jgi:hypothetical protein
LWTAAGCGFEGRVPGELVPTSLYGPSAAAGAESLAACQKGFMRHLFKEVVAFAGEANDECSGCEVEGA